MNNNNPISSKRCLTAFCAHRCARNAHNARNHHERAFKRIDRVVERVETIEKTMPNLMLASSWVFKAAISVMAVLGVAAVGTVLRGMFG